ncbi:MAG: CopG family transcriptional regulator [Actinomycetota bacterium]|nr:CopG family transcriptional regulator [Actinomycetota bacterium]
MELDQDTARAIEALRREHGLGLSEAVNELIRRGLVARPAHPPFRQRTASLGLRVDVSSVADALEVLHGAAMR